MFKCLASKSAAQDRAVVGQKIESLCLARQNTALESGWEVRGQVSWSTDWEITLGARWTATLGCATRRSTGSTKTSSGFPENGADIATSTLSKNLNVVAFRECQLQLKSGQMMAGSTYRANAWDAAEGQCFQ